MTAAQNIKAPGHAADCKGTPYFYDGLLGYEAMKCDACGYELDLNADANAKATAEREAAKPQAQHSRLPWRLLDGAILSENVNDYGNFIIVESPRRYADETTQQDDRNMKLIVASVNNAEKLAEACQSIAKLSEGWTSEQMNYAIRKAQSVLSRIRGEQIGIAVRFNQRKEARTQWQTNPITQNPTSRSRRRHRETKAGRGTAI